MCFNYFLDRADGSEVSLVYCKRGLWFIEKTPTLFETGNILAGYRKTSVAQIRRNFTEAKMLEKSLFDTRPHQSSKDGRDKTLPLFAPLFFNTSIIAKLGTR